MVPVSVLSSGRGGAADAPKSSSLRLRQGIVFLLGAGTLYGLERGPLDFFWTPLILGLAYLAAALIGGRRGGHWPTALVLIGWGLAVLLVQRGLLDVNTAGAYLAGAGLGALAAAAVDRAGFDADPLGVAATVFAAGLLLALTSRFPLLGQVEIYCVALAAVGLVNVLLALRR